MVNKIYIKTSLLFGSICTVLVTLYFFTFYFLGVNPLLQMSRFDLLIVMACMASGILYYRNMLNSGKLHFWEALVIGNIINFVGTLLSTVAIYIFIAFLDSEVLSQYITEIVNRLTATRQQMEENLGKETVANVIKGVLATTPSDIALDLFIKKIIICFLASGIIGAFLRRV